MEGCMPNGREEGKALRMSGNPDSADAGDGSSSDTGFGESSSDTGFDELLAQVAKGPQATLLPEGSLVGEYRIVKLLGRGAFGAVYHATHVVIGKQVALKVLAAQFSEDAAMAARFVDEARAVNRIAHPNIVDIFGFGALPDGRKYCVMELLTGETLGANLERCGRLSVSEATEILTQVASALDAAHAASIVHRDLKPDNIFLCRVARASFDSDSASGAGLAGGVKVKLLDFGIAQIADGLHQRTGSNMMLGTPAYMSPEQCQGAQVDFRSDIYALGVVLFEVLTGGLPFQGSNAFQVTSKHLTVQPPAPSTRLPTLSASIDSAVLCMLSKSPGDRPASAASAIRALSGAVSLPPPSSALSAFSSSRPVAAGSRKRLLAAVGALALLGGVLIGGLGLLTSRVAPDAPTAERAVGLGAPGSAPSFAVAAPAPLASLAPASPPARVALRVEGQPASAKVFLGKVELAKLGQPFELPRSDEALSLSVKAPGFARKELRVVPSRDAVLQVQLVPASRTAVAGQRRNPDLEY